jgi:Ala-tRNA(Pro) deacylase
MDIYDFLESKNIAYTCRYHAPVYTVEEANRIVPPLDGAHTKNLFLRDKKATRLFLVVCMDDKKVNLNALSAKLGVNKLSMASPERLKASLGIEPGAVSILALLNDQAGAVELIIDEKVWKAEAITAHPLVNTATMVLKKADLERFLHEVSHTPLVIRV